MGWWYWLLPATGGSSYGSGVSHIHNLGAVCIGEGGKAQFFGTLCPQLGGRSEWLGAICPEIAGRSSARGAEPLRYLPFGTIAEGIPHTYALGAVSQQSGGFSEWLGAVCPEIAGRSSARGAEPLRYLPFGTIATDQSRTHNIGAIMPANYAAGQFFGAVCPEIAGITSARGAEPLRYLPFGALGT